MNDTSFRIYKLASQGFCCTQIMLKMILEDEKRENISLIKAVNGLCGGLGFSKRTCGVLTGGICILGLYAGKGEPQEQKNDNLMKMAKEYLDWFENEFESLDCGDIIGVHVISDENGNINYPVKCGNIILKSYEKVQQVLSEYEYDLGYME